MWRRATVTAAGAAIGASGALVLVSFLVFIAVEALPGDAATRLLGQNASPAGVAELRDRLGLDRPVLVRYWSWLLGVIGGDLGVTATGGSAVAETLWRPARNSAALAGCAGLGAVVIALSMGIISGSRDRRRGDGVSRTASLVIVAVPDFVIATGLVVVLAGMLGWLPAVSLMPVGGSPIDRPAALVVPGAAIAISAGAFGARLVRAVVADAWRRPHVDAALVAGLPRRSILLRHVLSPAAGPLVRVVVLLAPYLVGGTAAVERIVGFPGLGTLLATSIVARDVRVVQAVVLAMATVIVTALVLGDFVAQWCDARAGGQTR